MLLRILVKYRVLTDFFYTIYEIKHNKQTSNRNVLNLQDNFIFKTIFLLFEG